MKSTLTKLIWNTTGKSRLFRLIYILASTRKNKINKETIQIAINYFNPDIGNKNKIYKDILKDIYRYGIEMDEYFLFEFYKLDESEKKTYLTRYNRLYYYSLFNDLRFRGVFANKYETYQHYKEFYKREIVLINKSLNNFDEFKAFVKKNPKFIWKALSESSGNSIQFINMDTYQTVSEVYTMLREKNGVCEELIIQDEEFGKIHPYSVNTIRIPQIIKKSGDTKIFHPVIRVGQAKNKVDNAGQGGIFAEINPDTGVIISDGLDYSGNTYFNHPNTNIGFKGFKIPDWDQAISLIHKIGNVTPDVRYISWDLAYTKKGWIVVEGNFAGEFKILQIVAKKGLKNELQELI